MIYKIKIFIFIIFLIYKNPLSDEKFEAIIASVDSEAITTYDLSERIKLVLKSLELDDNIKNRDSVRDRVLELLIIEKLKKIEASKAKIEVSEDEVIEFASVVYKFPKENFENFRSFLEDENIDFEIVLEQIKNELLWKKLSQQLFASKITINSADIDAIVNNFKNKIGKIEYNFSEITLLNNNVNDWKTSKKKLSTVISLIESGTSFQLIASKFSDVNSSERSFRQNWILEDDLDFETRKILEGMKTGEINKNIKIDNGYKLIKLNKKRKFGNQDSKLSFLKFSSLERNRIDSLSLLETNCNNLNEMDLNDEIKFLEINDISAKDLSSVFLDQIETTPVNKFTKVFEIDGEYNLIFVCEKNDSEIKPISREIVERRAFSKKFNQLSNTYLSNIRKSTNIKFFNK